MNNGAYNQKVIIQKSVITKDEIGNDISSWIDFKKGYAYVNGLSGREYWEAAQTQSENSVDFLLKWHHYYDSVDSTSFRLVFDGFIYDIKTIDNIQFKNKHIKIRAISKGERL